MIIMRRASRACRDAVRAGAKDGHAARPRAGLFARERNGLHAPLARPGEIQRFPGRRRVRKVRLVEHLVRRTLARAAQSPIIGCSRLYGHRHLDHECRCAPWSSRPLCAERPCRRDHFMGMNRYAGSKPDFTLFEAVRARQPAGFHGRGKDEIVQHQELVWEMFSNSTPTYRVSAFLA